MSFVLPEPDEILYRLWRLRRLILVGAAAPALLWMLIGLLAWPFSGVVPSGYLVLFFFTALMLGLHAFLFPNANEETVALAAAITLLTLLEPMIGFSLLARFGELILFCVLFLVGPRFVLPLALRSRTINMVVRARLVCDAPADKARRHFPPRPGQELAYRLCGAADAARIFPVTLAPAGPVGLDADKTMSGPQVWARITRDDPADQETEFLARDELGKLVPVSVLRHSFVPGPEGCRVEEVETVPNFPLGLKLLLWAVDFQQDGLIAARDALEGRTSMTLRMAHRDTLGALILGSLRPEWAAERG